MLQFIIKRILISIPTVIAITVIAFIIIQLPPGSYLQTYIAQLQESGYRVQEAEIEQIKHRYGLGQPVYIQYFKWVTGIIQGDFGFSFDWGEPVRDLIGSRIVLTLAVSISALLFSWILAFPIGIYSAVKQHTTGDYIFTFVGFLGLSIPNFMLALVLMYLAYQYLGVSVGGLFSEDYVRAAWSINKFIDLLKHIWIPMIVVGTAGTAALIRILRNNLLDELGKPYVVTARSKGLKNITLLIKYPIRHAIIPFVSTVGWQLPMLISRGSVVAIVLSLPTTGPLLLRALMNQDMYLAGSFLLILAVLTVIGTLISDILLAFIDPRIRYS